MMIKLIIAFILLVIIGNNCFLLKNLYIRGQFSKNIPHQFKPIKVIQNAEKHKKLKEKIDLSTILIFKYLCYKIFQIRPTFQNPLLSIFQMQRIAFMCQLYKIQQMPNLVKSKSAKLTKKKSKISQRINTVQEEHSSALDENDEKKQPILVPLLEMADPYYPKSLLAKSLFAGFYFLFFMYCVIFIIAYPILSLFEPDNIFNLSLHTVLQTALVLDLLSVLGFFILSLLVSEVIVRIPKLPFMPTMGFIASFYFGTSLLVVHKFQMYFTDRIFIIVVSWGLCLKIASLLKNSRGEDPQSISDRQQKKQKSWRQKQQAVNKFYKGKGFMKRMIFFITPIPIYKKFIEQHNPYLKINIKYLLIRTLTAILCLCVNNILIVKFIEPICTHHQSLSLLSLIFKLIPPTFYINMTLYFLVMDNIMSALSEITRIRDRRLYGDWWNSTTIYQFLEKWCLIISMVSDQFYPKVSRQLKHTINTCLIIVMTMCIFGRSLRINWLNITGLLAIILATYFLGGNRTIQNNYIVHLLVMGFTPCMIGLHVKYDIFSTI